MKEHFPNIDSKQVNLPLNEEVPKKPSGFDDTYAKKLGMAENNLSPLVDQPSGKGKLSRILQRDKN